MQACSLSAHDLACRRGERLLFRKLTLDMAGGEALHIAGPNGVGKSSLLRMLAGLLPPFAGHVTHDGAIALLDERPALDPQISLGDGLAFWASLDRRPNGAPNETLAGVGDNNSALHIMGIAELHDVPFRYLSTGQRKRAAFARVLQQSAPIWLLDEPLNGLDTDAQSRIARCIAAHCEAGGICIAASHQPIPLPGSNRLALMEYIP